MSGRTRDLLLAVAVMFGVGLLAGLWMSDWFCDLSEARCAMIRRGMSKDEVIGLLGSPGEYCRWPYYGPRTYCFNSNAYTIERLEWRNGTYVVTVSMDRDGRVLAYARAEGR